MKKSKRILSFVLAVIMVASIMQISLPVYANDTTSTVNYVKDPDPGVTVSCSEITWISAGLSSLNKGNVIVPATPSGIPLILGGGADKLYAGETPEYTTIKATFTNLPDESLEPKIACTSGGHGVVISTPTLDKATKTYIWTVTGGTSENGNVLEFSITYKFNGKNYTNKAYSYVRDIAQPAGSRLTVRLITKSYSFTGSTLYAAGVDVITRLLGKNLYYSLSDISGFSIEQYRGYYNAAANSFEPVNLNDYNMIARTIDKYEDNTSSSTIYEVNPYKPYADLYIDSSVTPTLESLNLRSVVNCISNVGYNQYQHVSTSFAKGNYSSVSGAGMSASGHDELGYSGHSGEFMWPGDQSYRTLTGSGYADNNEYTLMTQMFGQDSQVRIYGFTAIGLRMHVVDKSELRNTIQKILKGNLYDDDNPLSQFCLNKGNNPQSWQFKSGWSDFAESMRDANKFLLKPNATQAEIDAAVNLLVNAYGNLQLKRADYTDFNVYSILAEEAIAKDNEYNKSTGGTEYWYNQEKMDELKDVLSKAVTGCNIMYQAQVDIWTAQIKEAYENLEVLPADYTKLNAIVEEANKLAENKMPDGSSIYVDFSNVAAAVAAVRYDLTKEQQDMITLYENTIRTAIDNLVIRSADYSEVETAVAKAMLLNKTASNYTNFSIVRSAVNKVRYNLKITEQARVDGFAAGINEAISKLNPKSANYIELEAKIAEANEKLVNREYYTPDTISALETALNNCEGYENIDILNQSKIDNLKAALQEALGNLVMYDADYSEVDAAIEQWEKIPESEKDMLQQSSIQAIAEAISAVVRGKKIDEQQLVDEYAVRISNAVQNREYVSADYSRVNAAILKAEGLDRSYWADMSPVDNAVNSVKWGLGLNRQSEVDNMALAIYDAIDQLVPGPADYSRVNAAITRFEELNKNHYTLDSLQMVENVINSINWNLTKADQAEVIVFAYDINEAILNLVEADADYKELRSVLEKIPSNLDELYTEESLVSLKNTIATIDWSLKAKDQEIVNGYVEQINNDMKLLVYLPGDYTEVDQEIAIGRGLIENGIEQEDGTFFEVSKESALDFEEFVANLDRTCTIMQSAKISEIAQSVRLRYQQFTYAESIHHAKIRLETDKSNTYIGDTITVSVILETDYYAAASAIPVLYNSEYYDIVGSGISAFEFSGSYVEGAQKSANTNSPAKGYPSSYTQDDISKWKYAYVAIAPVSSLSDTAVKLDPEQTIVTFQLKVKEDLEFADSVESRIWIDPAFTKTEDNLGGKLYVGRYENSSVDLNYVSYGQTIDLSGADLSILIYNLDAPAVFDKLLLAIENVPEYDESYYKEDTYENYIAAIDEGQAIIDDQDSYTIKDQAIIDQATKNITEAFENLALKDADTSLLEDMLALELEYLPEQYSEDTYQMYLEAVENGNSILAEENLSILDDERIIEAATLIEEAYYSLTLKDFSYWDELNVILYELMPMYSDESAYDEELYNEFWVLYDEACVLGDSGLTVLDDEVGLEFINNYHSVYLQLEKSALQTVVDSCTIEYDESMYDEEMLDSYKSAYEAATEKLNDEEITFDNVSEIVEYAEALRESYENLSLKPFSYEEEVWATLDTFPQDEEHIVAETLQAFWNAYGELNIFAYNYSESWTIVNDEEALTLINKVRDAYNNLVIQPADTSALRAAVNLPTEYDESFYTADSYALYVEAVEYGRTLYEARYDKQDEVDSATQVITDAYNALELKPFTKLEDVTNALLVVPSLDESEYVASYWQAYIDAKNALEEIVANAENLTIADDRDALDKIDAYNQAIESLENEGLVPEADYSVVEEAIANANNKLSEMQATGYELVQSTVDALNEAINNVDYTLDGLKQDVINAYADEINKAADALEFVPVIIINDGYKDIVTVEDGYILGLADIASEDDIKAAFSNIGNATIVVEASDNGYGTGTIVKLVDNDTNEALETLTIVVIADVNGDGFVDSFDEAIVTEYINNFEEPEDEAVMKAMDVFADGWLDATDLAYIIYMANYEVI